MTTTAAANAVEQLADLERRLADIPHERDALQREREQKLRAGPGAISRVQQIDKRLTELRTEEEVLQASRTSAVRRAHAEQQQAAQRVAAALDIRRHELLAEAQALVEEIVNRFDRLDKLVAARQLPPEEQPTILHWLRQVGAAVTNEWPAALVAADQQARAARVFLNTGGGS